MKRLMIYQLIVTGFIVITYTLVRLLLIHNPAVSFIPAAVISFIPLWITKRIRSERHPMFYATEIGQYSLVLSMWTVLWMDGTISASLLQYLIGGLILLAVMFLYLEEDDTKPYHLYHLLQSKNQLRLSALGQFAATMLLMVIANLF